MEPDPANNGTTESTTISRSEFLKILDRNLKGLARLRSLEWREARKVRIHTKVIIIICTYSISATF